MFITLTDLLWIDYNKNITIMNEIKEHFMEMKSNVGIWQWWKGTETSQQSCIIFTLAAYVSATD